MNLGGWIGVYKYYVIPNYLFLISDLINVWIIGHSCIFWTHHRAEYRNYGITLGLPPSSFNVFWYGRRGMKWSNLFSTLSILHESWPTPEDYYFSLGRKWFRFKKNIGHYLANHIGFVLSAYTVLQNCILVFAEVVPRLFWLNPDFRPFVEIRKKG